MQIIKAITVATALIASIALTVQTVAKLKNTSMGSNRRLGKKNAPPKL